jgi:hypothetical protein
MKGSSLVEVQVATLLTALVLSALFAVLNPAMAMFDSQSEAADLQQRLRVAVATLQREIALAGAGSITGPTPGPLIRYLPPLMPYRAGAERADPPGTFRHDTITIVYVPQDPAAALSTRTYYVKSDREAGTDQLMHFDGESTDSPVVDDVVKLEFRYFAEGALELPRDVLVDGPWLTAAAPLDRFDADLLRIRRIRVTIRAQVAAAHLRGSARQLFVNPGHASVSRMVADQELTFDVSPPNMNMER